MASNPSYNEEEATALTTVASLMHCGTNIPAPLWRKKFIIVIVTTKPGTSWR